MPRPRTWHGASERAQRGRERGAFEADRAALTSAAVPSPLAARRIEIYSSVRAFPPGFLSITPGRLRFSLGASLADLSVPVEVTNETRAIVRGAALQAAMLVERLHRDLVGEEALEKLMLREEYATLPAVAPKMGSPPGNPDLRSAAQSGPIVHPALWGGLIGAWMGKGGRGRSLVGLWIELLKKALLEMRSAKNGEATPYLVALVLASEMAEAERSVREVLPPRPLDRFVAEAAMAACFIAAQTGLARVRRDSGPNFDDRLMVRMEAVLSPPGMRESGISLAPGTVTAYGCELVAEVPLWEQLVEGLVGRLDVREVTSQIEARLKADPDSGHRAEEAVAVARVREELAKTVVRLEADGLGPSLERPRHWFTSPGAIARAFTNAEERRRFLSDLSGLGRRATDGPFAQIATTLERFNEKEPAVSVGLDPRSAQLLYSEAATAWLCDLALDRLASRARRSLNFRTGREAEGGLEVEWEGGRLYRFSPRAEPILKDPVERPVGHLFADVKDFTRRTSLLGQASMADFLRREFYVPILDLAREHYNGMGHLADRGGVTVNNLLGDAISLTGSIEAMVAIARGIRTHLAALALRLSKEISGEAVARQIVLIEAEYAKKGARAAAVRGAYERLLQAEPPDSTRQSALALRLSRARADEGRVAADRERALGRARGEILEAGVFVSFGPAPVVIAVDDEVFGPNRVAVAEKINESARGTARATSARARADAGLRRERALRGNPVLAHSWSVFLGQSLTVTIPPDLEDAAVRAFRSGDGAGGMRALSPSLHEALEAVARGETAERPGDIYNGGAALSEEALSAFLAEVGEERTVRRLEILPEEIPDDLRNRFYFGDEPISLVACFAGEDRVRELFRRVGQAAFKGMAEVTVWELCADEGGPRALSRALAPGWWRTRTSSAR